MKTIASKMFAAAVLFTTAFPAAADMQDEIRYLLAFVEASGCVFERNGKVYDSKKARSHIQKKYDYAKRHMDEAEDFIKYAATGSSMSGKNYHVTCSGNKQTSAEWLHGELSRYRADHAMTGVVD